MVVRLMSRLSRSSLLVGAGIGAALTAVAMELPYVNWRLMALPVDARPLVIRQDAKGDGRFGSPRSGNRRHRGIDLVAPVGSPVRAVQSGRVIQIGTHRGLGRFIELEHRHRLSSLYAHLSGVRVAVGQRVRQGQAIGAVGKTGNARHRWITPHLHLEILRGAEPINPQTLGLRAVEPAPRSGLLATDHHPAEPAASSDASGGE